MKSEESPTGRVRIAVLGKFNVGKSALTVRYLTRRFIGEYSSNTDLLYRQSVLINGVLRDVEIFDASGETRDSLTPSEAPHLAADGVVLVYSITDRDSYLYAQRVLDLLNAVHRQGLGQGRQHLPVTLLANKADLAHLRTVEESEGRSLAESSGTPFYEVSVAEDSANLYQAFRLLVWECHTAQVSGSNCNSSNSSSSSDKNNNNNNSSSSNGRLRKFSVTKMLGNLIGSKCSSPPPSSPSGSSATQSTVVVCQKSDLYRSSVLSRRHKTSITVSL